MYAFMYVRMCMYIYIYIHTYNYIYSTTYPISYTLDFNFRQEKNRLACQMVMNAFQFWVTDNFIKKSDSSEDPGQVSGVGIL